MKTRAKGRRSDLLAAAMLAAAALIGAAAAEAADRTIEPGAAPRRHAHVHRHRHVRHYACADDRAAIKHLKYVLHCAIVPPPPWLYD